MTSRPTTRWIAATLAALTLLLASCGSDDPAEPVASGAPDTSASVPAPTTTERSEQTSIVLTPLEPGDLAIYSEAGGTEVASTLQHPKYINGDPNAAVDLVLLVKQQVGDWFEVYLPVRPNGSTGWVPASEVSASEHDFRIEVALEEFRLQVFDGDEKVFEAEIGVARDNAPTPAGIFYTTELLMPPEGPEGAYGTYAYGLSGHSDAYETFNGGPGQLGIHGTNQPELIGTKVSSGCIRLRNEDITTMAEDLGLPLGVPVIVS